MISSWLLGIAGVVMLSVLAELMLPEGQINKYIKIIFSFAIVLVVISPLPKIFKMKFDVDKFLGGSGQLQEEYLEQVNVDKLNALGKDIGLQIEKEGLLNVEIHINANVLAKELEIEGVLVDLSRLKFDKKFASKDISKAKARVIEIVHAYDEMKDVEVKFRE